MQKAILITLILIAALLALNLTIGTFPAVSAKVASPPGPQIRQLPHLGKYQISAWAYGDTESSHYGYFVIDTTTGEIVRKEIY